jgi:hypothetical protein
MSSSRSIAAARARRSNEPAPPVNGSRPITSIGSQAAFANMPQQPPSNIRIARGPPMPPQQQMYQQMPPPPSQMYQQMAPPPQMLPGHPQGPALPFSKLSISDAIGLVTLRLGRVEQFIIDLENGEHQHINMGISNIPDNSKIIDNSVLSSMINRLDSLEKREPATMNYEQIGQVTEDIKVIQESVKRLNDELVKTNLSAAKHSEQMLRFEREFVENKDILKSLLIKFDLFVRETNDKFADYEYAIADLEKNLQLPIPDEEIVISSETQDLVNNTLQEGDTETESNIMSVDLKNIIKQELANENI